MSNTQPVTLPNGVVLRDPEDYTTLRNDIFNAAKEELESSFPKSYGGVRLELHDVGYEGPDTFGPAEEYKAKMEDGYLFRKLRGTARLVDEATGDVLDERRTSLMRVPWLSDRGTFLHNGNHYSMSLQARLTPGAYTRKKGNGLMETQFNVRPGTGRAFRVAFDPESVQYHLGVGGSGGSQLHLYSLLKDMGHDDDQLRQAWGDRVFEENAAKYDARVLGRAYRNLVPKWKQLPGASRDDQAAAVKEAIESAQVAANVVKRTLPNLFDRMKAAEWRAKAVGQEIGFDEFIKQAAELEFAPDWTPTGLLVQRLQNHADILADARLFYTKAATYAVDLDGTLAESEDGDFDPEKVGAPVPAMVERVRGWLKDGKKVIIFTARAADEANIPPVRAWLKELGDEFADLEITNRKTYDIEEIWDDRAVGVKRNEGVKVASDTCPGCGCQFAEDEPYPDVDMCEACERFGPPKDTDSRQKEARSSSERLDRLRARRGEFYHGSPLGGLTQIDPKSSRVIDGEEAVFLSHDPDYALTFAAPWRDDDLEHGHVDGQFYMREKRPNAFEEIFDRPGSVYQLGPKEDQIEHDPRLTRTERIVRSAVPVALEKAYPNVWEELQKRPSLLLLRHGEVAPWEKDIQTKLAGVVRNYGKTESGQRTDLHNVTPGDNWDYMDVDLPGFGPALLGVGRLSDKSRLYMLHKPELNEQGVPMINKENQLAYMAVDDVADGMSEITALHTSEPYRRKGLGSSLLMLLDMFEPDRHKLVEPDPFSDKKVARDHIEQMYLKAGYFPLSGEGKGMLGRAATQPRKQAGFIGAHKEAVVRQEGGKWKLYTRDGKRVLGTHDKPEEAYKQEYAIQKSKEKQADIPANLVTWIPRVALDSVRKHGLLGANALLENPEALALAAQARGKTADEFAAEIRQLNKARSWRASQYGPNAFFKEPPAGWEAPENHPSNKMDLTRVQILLDDLLQDQPDTVLHGQELLPYDEVAWDQRGEDYAETRHHDLSPEELRDLRTRSAEELWRHFNDIEGDGKYAPNVPHAVIKTPNGRIDPKYLVFDEAPVKQASEALPVELGERKSTYWICPHCKEEIHEKHSYPKDPEWWKTGGPLIEVHKGCGGEFLPPPADPAALEWLSRWKTASTPPVALEWQPMPLYDWDGTLINKLPGGAAEYLDGLQAVDLTELGESLKGAPVDILTARPPMFHRHIRNTADRLGLQIGDIHHAPEKADIVRLLTRRLVDDSPDEVERVRAQLGPDAADLYEVDKAAGADPDKLRLARQMTEQPKSYEQAEAGNQPKGKLAWNGLTIRIENPKGSVRKGMKPDGSVAWQSKMHHDYGYIVGTTGVDGDEIDVFIGPDLSSELVYVVDQIDQTTGAFDEHKCVMGANSKDEARTIYLKAYSDGWKPGKITAMTFDQFKVWVRDGRKRKPVSDLQMLKVAATDGFQPDFSGDEMKNVYETIYCKTGPRLASMKQWPDRWFPPGSDQLGWVSWYRRYADGTRTDDDARQIARWKRFKARELPKFLKNPTPRAAFQLTYWGVDPLKYLPEEARAGMKAEMDAYKQDKHQAWLREKTASLDKEDLLTLFQFLNTEHSAGLPTNGEVEDLENALKTWLGLDNPAAAAMYAASQIYPEPT